MASLIDIVKKGSVDRAVTLRIIDSTDGTPETGVVWNSAGIDLWYRREGSAVVSITEATLAALTTAHTDGGFLHISHGEYRFDLPDAAFATGAQHVDIGGTVTGMVVIGGRVRLVDYDPEDAVRLGLTAMPPNAAGAAGGIPVSAAGGLNLDDIKTKTDGLNFDGNNVLCDVMAMNTGVIASINFSTGALAADAFAANSLDGKGNWNTVVPDAAGTAPTSAEIKTAIEAGGSSLAQILVDTGTTLPASLPAALTKGTADSGTTTTMVDAARTEADTDYWKDSLIRFTSGTISGQTRLITGFTPASNTITFFPAVTQAVATNTYEILPAAFGDVLVDWIDGGRLDLLLDALQADLDNGTDGLGALKALIDTLTTTVGTAGVGLTDLGGMSTGMKAEINVEVDGALDTAISELGVAVPTATPTMRTGLMLLYMALRNKLDVQTSATDALEIHNNAGTQITKKLITDDGSDYSEAKMS